MNRYELVDSSGMASLRNLVESTPSLQGSLSRITLYTGVFGAPFDAAQPVEGDEYLGIQGNTSSMSLPASGALPATPLYEILGPWANTIVMNTQSSNVTAQRSELAHYIGRVLGSIQPYYTPPGHPIALADRWLMDRHRDNTSSCAIPASVYRSQAYKVARKIVLGQR